MHSEVGNMVALPLASAHVNEGQCDRVLSRLHVQALTTIVLQLDKFFTCGLGSGTTPENSHPLRGSIVLKTVRCYCNVRIPLDSQAVMCDGAFEV